MYDSCVPKQQLAEEQYLLDSGCISDCIDAAIATLHPQVIICDDGSEVGLTALWQGLLQLHRQTDTQSGILRLQ